VPNTPSLQIYFSSFQQQLAALHQAQFGAWQHRLRVMII
jgi:hypothetical protein